MIKRPIIFQLLIMASVVCQAQKKPLDHTVYDDWKSIAGTQMTSDGKYLVYEVNPQEGDGTLVVRRISDGKEIKLPRGYKAQLATDNKTACALIKSPFAEIRKKRNKNTPKDMMPKDSWLSSTSATGASPSWSASSRTRQP